LAHRKVLISREPAGFHWAGSRFLGIGRIFRANGASPIKSGPGFRRKMFRQLFSSATMNRIGPARDY
jgi:hypothetical protein